MTNKQLAQMLRSAASALEHGRRRTASQKTATVANALGLIPNAELLRSILDLGQQDIYTDAPEYAERVQELNVLLRELGQKIQGIPSLLLSMPDSAIEVFDAAISAAESELEALLSEYATETIVSYFAQQVTIHMRTELDGDRTEERRLKNTAHPERICPICKGEL